VKAKNKQIIRELFVLKKKLKLTGIKRVYWTQIYFGPSIE